MDDSSPLLLNRRITPPHQEFLAHLARQLDPRPGERWLDLEGGGQLAVLLWRLSAGQLAELVCVDRAENFSERFESLLRQLTPAPREGQIRYLVGNAALGLPRFADGEFDGVVAGESLGYAEAQDPATGRYSDAAYNRVLAECRRLLKPGGRLVLSVDAPGRGVGPQFLQAVESAPPAQALFDALFLERYSQWLRRQGKRGRFHFPTESEIAARLGAAGFAEWESQPSSDGGGYIIRAYKPAAASRKAA